MNRKQVKKYIDKINALNNSIMADEAYSEMETDLLESYAKSLLEAITERKASHSTDPKPVVMADPIAPKVATPPSVLEEPVVEPSKPVIEPIKDVKPPEVKIETPKVEEKVPVAAETPPPTLTPPPATKPILQTTPETAPVAVKEIPELIELFEHKAVKELSDRLRMQPIKDLTTAISINERIFTTQELFGGDQDKFKTTIAKINGMASYDDAKKYLISGIAKENEWYSEGKQKKAAQFIQLVKRRFSSN